MGAVLRAAGRGHRGGPDGGRRPKSLSPPSGQDQPEDRILEGAEARQAVAEAARRTTSRRDLARSEHFAQVSPEVGELDEAAFDELYEEDPDAALALLAELTGATDEGLRRLARRVAARVVVEAARAGLVRSGGVGRLVRRRGGDGDVDLDRSLDAVAGARAAGLPAHVDELTTAGWARPASAVCLLVDRSGSMAGERLATAAVAAAAVRLRHGVDASVVAFGNDAVVLAAHGEHRDPEAVVGDLLRLRGHGTTDVALALRAAKAQLGRAGAGRRVAVLLSDCRWTSGEEPTEAARALDELVVLAPSDDLDDARALAASAGVRCLGLRSPSTVAETLAEALSR